MLHDKQFVFVFGKGGVGKTVVSAAAALALAAEGKRVLVAFSSARENLSALLETEPLTHEIRTLLPGVDAVNIEPGHALREYGEIILRSKTVSESVFGNRFVMGFLRGTPGMDAWAVLGKAYYHAVEESPRGTRRYDTVIFDAPATGHALDMLRVPLVIREVAPPGLLRREADAALSLFQNPARTGALLVTLPEDMPVNETCELHRTLVEELRIPVSGVLVNRHVRAHFTEAEDELLSEHLGALVSDETVGAYARAARRHLRRLHTQQVALRTLGHRTGARLETIREVLEPRLSRASIAEIASAFRGFSDT